MLRSQLQEDLHQEVVLHAAGMAVPAEVAAAQEEAIMEEEDPQEILKETDRRYNKSKTVQPKRGLYRF